MRAGRWLLGAGGYIAVLTLMMTSSADLAANGTGWRFLAPQVAAIVMAAAAMLAAFSTTIPGAPSRLWAVEVTAAIWVATLLASAFQNSGGTGGAAAANPEEWRCIAWAVVGGALPATGAVVMLRRGAVLTPPLTGALVAIAVGALTNVSACISHPHLNNLGVLVWHGGTIVIFALLAAWRTPRLTPIHPLRSRDR
jgi:hypothetical protein